MFRLYSKGCAYALRALVCAAATDGGKRFKATTICRRAGIPEAYTRKVFQALVQGKFLRAVLGPGGGYELSRPPGEISILEVIRAVDGEDTFDQCIMGLPQCGCEQPCPLHPVWEEAKKALLQRLAQNTLQDLVTSTTSSICSETEQKVMSKRQRNLKLPRKK